MSRPRITWEMRRQVAARDGLITDGEMPTLCAYCETPLTWTLERGRVRLLDTDRRSTPELDHVVPLAIGGPHLADNLVPACLTCNRGKGTYRQTPKRMPKQTLELLLRHHLRAAMKQVSEQMVGDRGEPRPVPSRSLSGFTNLEDKTTFSLMSSGRERGASNQGAAA